MSVKPFLCLKQMENALTIRNARESGTTPE